MRERSPAYFMLFSGTQDTSIHASQKMDEFVHCLEKTKNFAKIMRMKKLDIHALYSIIVGHKYLRMLVLSVHAIVPFRSTSM